MPAGNLAAAARPPFVLRARLLTPLGAGGTLFDTDRRLPDGIDHVTVNGRLVVDLGEHTGALPRRALRHARGGAG